MKIIDCFIFYNEIELLKYRLSILYDIVDYFVIVESSHTFTGKEKPLFFSDNKLFEEYRPKIIHVVVNNFPYIYPEIDYSKGEQWDNEKYQRFSIGNGIKAISLSENDLITICDIDEIPNPMIIRQIKEQNMELQFFGLEMDMYYYNLNSKSKCLWNLPKIMSYTKFKEIHTMPSEFHINTREERNFSSIANGGWHLSSFGDASFIKNKIENFSHQDLNIDIYTNIEKIQNRIENSVDYLDRSDNPITRIKIQENTNLPPNYEILLKRFYTE